MGSRSKICGCPALESNSRHGYEPRYVGARPPPPPPASRIDVPAYARLPRTWEPDDPELTDTEIEPFRFDDLEHISREVADIERTLLAILPEAIVRRSSRRRSEDRDAPLGPRHRPWFHSARVVERSQLRAIVPGHTLIAVVGLVPRAEKLLVEIDLRFVYRVVHSLLGGRGAAVDVHRPPTEIEHGVFSFLLLEVLALFQAEAANPAQVGLRLEDTRHDLKSTADILRTDERWAVLSWKMNFELDVGYVRVFAPASLARVFRRTRFPVGSPGHTRALEHVRARMGRLHGTSVEASVEIGRIELSPADLEKLDPGDIIVLDETQVELGENGVQGAATMKIGLGRCGVVHGIVGVPEDSSDGQIMFQVESIEITEVPPEHDPHDAPREAASPEEVIAAYEDGQPADAEESYDEADDGSSSADEIEDEDFGVDDEDARDEDDEYDEYESDGAENYDEAGEDGGAGDVAHAQGEDELAVDDSGQPRRGRASLATFRSRW